MPATVHRRADRSLPNRWSVAT